MIQWNPYLVFNGQFGMLTDQFGVPWMINCKKAS